MGRWGDGAAAPGSPEASRRRHRFRLRQPLNLGHVWDDVRDCISHKPGDKIADGALGDR